MNVQKGNRKRPRRGLAPRQLGLAGVKKPHVNTANQSRKVIPLNIQAKQFPQTLGAPPVTKSGSPAELVSGTVAYQNDPKSAETDIKLSQESALVQVLRKEAAELKHKNANLEEANFSLQAELICKAAEEKHGRAKAIESLKTRLEFQQKELQSALEKISRYEKGRNATKTKRTSDGQKKVDTEIGRSKPVLASIDSSFSQFLGNDKSFLRVLRESDEAVADKIFASLLPSPQEFAQPSFHLEERIVEIGNELIRLSCKNRSPDAMVVFCKLLITLPSEKQYPFFGDPEVLSLVNLLEELDLDQEQDSSLHKVIVDVLILIVSRKCSSGSIAKVLLDKLSYSRIQHTVGTFELFSELIATHIGQHSRKLVDGKDAMKSSEVAFQIPDCAAFFHAYTHGKFDASVVRLCATLVSVMKVQALKEFYKQNLIRELVIVINRIPLNPSSDEKEKIDFRAASSLLLLLLRYYLDIKRKQHSISKDEANKAKEKESNKPNALEIERDEEWKHELISTLLTISRLDTELKSQAQPILEEFLSFE
eukprot:CAMPEP_0184012982 /NCGR_PEP_ID=MMETSP0954-20121128/4754_1 /TAXON_ID=627963 /ORGANISM="Aplanochytrium sp, Strain PBS07" /LENGTH=536 /DNA_ID=CAMNT_0026293109 /DNA_START=93 /DNA_END=1703 /DNA_ORIENTATION=-